MGASLLLECKIAPSKALVLWHFWGANLYLYFLVCTYTWRCDRGIDGQLTLQAACSPLSSIIRTIFSYVYTKCCFILTNQLFYEIKPIVIYVERHVSPSTLPLSLLLCHPVADPAGVQPAPPPLKKKKKKKKKNLFIYVPTPPPPHFVS